MVLFGGQSFASGTASNREIFIESLTGPGFEPLEREAGLWIKEADIKYIEAIPD